MAAFYLQMRIVSVANDYGRHLVWKDEETMFHQIDTDKKQYFCSPTVHVWCGIKLNGKTELQIFN